MHNTQSLPPLSLHDAEDDRQATREWHRLSAYITDGPCREWELRWDSDAQEGVLKGTKAATYRGETYTIIDGRAPHHSGSTGRVYTAEGREFFPGVFDMRWVLTTE
jgi:hypothetical protein